MFSKIPNEELPSLFRILEQRLPKSGLLYNVTHLFLTKRLSSKVGVEFYICDEHETNSRISADSFIVIMQSFQYFPEKVVLISTPENVTEYMLTCFEELIDWRFPHTFGDIAPDFTLSLQEMCKKRTNKTVEIDKFNLFYFNSPPDAKITISCKNEEVNIKPLCSRDAIIVDKAWKESREGTLALFSDSIETITSAGVFFGNELISWGVTTPVGSINAVNTIEQFRRKGFAELTMKAIAEQNWKNGLISVAHVDPTNMPSLNLMRKVNFCHSHDVNWIVYSA